MNIVVCIKQIQDPELPAAKFRVDEKNLRILPPEGIPPVVSPYDAQAVELGLRLKEKHGGGLSVLTVGGDESAKAVKHALSMGADQGAVLSDPAFEGSDAFGVAHILARGIAKLGGFDLVLCGRQAADWDEGLTGAALAHELEVPMVSLAADIEAGEGKIRVRRMTIDGFQVFSAPLPALVTVSNEVGRPRLPSGWGIVQAARKKVPLWSAAELGADPAVVGAGAARRRLMGLKPASRERKCEIVQAETPTGAAAALAEKLRQAGLL